MHDCIIILGMHRSGTSCLTGCLNAHGLHLGGVSNYNKYNKKGNQENSKVFRLNESLLKENKGSWFEPPTDELMSTPQLDAQRDYLLQYYNSLEKPWGIKDPRMLLTFYFWKNHLPKYGLVGTFRHPKAVANSLQARDRLSIPVEQGYKLWSIYNQRLLQLHNQHQFKIINFDLEPQAYLEKVQRIVNSLNLDQHVENVFYDKSLVSQQKFTVEDCPDNLRATYEQLLNISDL